MTCPLSGSGAGSAPGCSLTAGGSEWGEPCCSRALQSPLSSGELIFPTTRGWRCLNPAAVAQGRWPRADAPGPWLGPDSRHLGPVLSSLLGLRGPEGCTGPAPSCRAQALGAFASSGSRSRVGPVALPPSLPPGSEDRLTICGCFAGCHCAWTCFSWPDSTGSGHRVSAQISAAVRADSVNSAATVRPRCVSQPSKASAG